MYVLYYFEPDDKIIEMIGVADNPQILESHKTDLLEKSKKYKQELWPKINKYNQAVSKIQQATYNYLIKNFDAIKDFDETIKTGPEWCDPDGKPYSKEKIDNIKMDRVKYLSDYCLWFFTDEFLFFKKELPKILDFSKLKELPPKFERPPIDFVTSAEYHEYVESGFHVEEVSLLI